MRELASLTKRAKRFGTSEIAKASGLSMRTVQYLFAGNASVTLRTMVAFERAVTRLEAKAAKTKPRRKTDKKQTASRDAGADPVAGGGK